jgi:hypothetical protein
MAEFRYLTEVAQQPDDHRARRMCQTRETFAVSATGSYIHHEVNQNKQEFEIGFDVFWKLLNYPRNVNCLILQKALKHVYMDTKMWLTDVSMCNARDNSKWPGGPSDTTFHGKRNFNWS